MARKNKPMDRLALLSVAAQKEGLTYGKYMAKYNYAPPCPQEPQDAGLAEETASRQTANNLRGVESEPEGKRCAVCGEIFYPRYRSDQAFCSRECKNAHACARQKKKRLEGKVQRYCTICGAPLPLSVSIQQKTCSNACSKQWEKANKSRRDKEYREREKGGEDQ